MSDVTQGSLTAEQVAEYIDALTRHFGEPVRPVSEVCNGIREWIYAIAREGTDGPFDQVVGAALREHGPTVATFAGKSNLLYRLLYAGEEVRTEKCPEHDGHWMGCPMPGDECPHGCTAYGNTTGWLPAPSPESRHGGGP